MRARGTVAAALAAIGAAGAFAATALAVPPANDNFASSQVVAGSSFSVNGTNVDATAESGEPEHAGEPATASVWYSWTAPASERVSIDTCASNFDTVLAVYTGSAVSALTLRGENDDSDLCPDTQSRVTFNAAAGTTYRIAVDGFAGDTGNVTLRLLRPANDAFANARALSGYDASASASNFNATAEAGEPAHAGQAAKRSVWFRWTAPDGGFTSVSTCFSGLDTMLAVYTGSAVNALAPIGSSDDARGCGRGGKVGFLARAGTTYRIAVDGYEGAEGSFGLRLKKQRSGRYRGRTGLLDFGKRVRLRITPDGARIVRFTFASELDCGFLTVIFRRIVVGAPIRIRPGGRFFSRTGIRGRGIRLTIRVTGELVPPDRVKGYIKATLRIRGVGRCTTFPRKIFFRVRHRG